ncbi:hypothetical protein VKS41_009114 [Umbelopsis sp. WA50703]
MWVASSDTYYGTIAWRRVWVSPKVFQNLLLTVQEVPTCALLNQGKALTKLSTNIACHPLTYSSKILSSDEILTHSIQYSEYTCVSDVDLEARPSFCSASLMLGDCCFLDSLTL